MLEMANLAVDIKADLFVVRAYNCLTACDEERKQNLFVACADWHRADTHRVKGF
jgi:hypothetical protein